MDRGARAVPDAEVTRMDQKIVEETLGTLSREFLRMRRELSEIPKTEGDLKELLKELADSDDGKAEHFKRFPRPEGGGKAYESPGFTEEAVQADWVRVLARFDKAVSALTAFARESRKRAP